MVHTIRLELDEADLARLRYLARSTGLDEADVLRLALVEHFDRHVEQVPVRHAIEEHVVGDAEVLRRLAET